MTPQRLEERLIDFAVTLVSVVEALPGSKAGNHIANPLIRSGTSPAPNDAEAQSAESRMLSTMAWELTCGWPWEWVPRELSPFCRQLRP